MNDGVVKLLLDAQTNEIGGQILVVGNGVVSAYNILNSLKKGFDSGGFGAADFKVYNDLKSAAAWGANHFGVFAPGNIGFAEYLKNVGTFAGERGGSLFFTLPVPVQLAGGALTNLIFDAQLKYNDCPDAGTPRGYVLILSKNYGLWNLPVDAFAATDRMRGFNGSLHYTGVSA
jgi:hypothetical protein